MGDMHEAGRKAAITRRANERARTEQAALDDAHYVISLYRHGFDNPKKGTARRRVLEAMVAARGKVILVLWGGGICADLAVALGFRVIACENGSMELIDPRTGEKVDDNRKKRALAIAAKEGGYEWRWGDAARYAHLADCAFLDFCGPWSIKARRTVTACRHMRAVGVTLTVDHDITTGAVRADEREWDYEIHIRLAIATRRKKTEARAANVRLFSSYFRSRGYPVWVYLWTAAEIRQVRTGLKIAPLTNAERRALHPEQIAAYNAKSVADYHALPEDVRKARNHQNYITKKERWAAHPEQREQARIRDNPVQRHRHHLQTEGKPLLPCEFLPCKDRWNWDPPQNVPVELMPRPCAFCGQLFTPLRKSTARYCSNSCSTNDWRRSRHEETRRSLLVSLNRK